MKRTQKQEKIKNIKNSTLCYNAIFNKKYYKEDLDEYAKQTNKPVLFVRHLVKKYLGKKKATLNDVSFNVYRGEFHAFIGANGAGKTTTIKSVIGAYSNWNGTILINGQKNNTEQAKKKIGYIPESARFPEGLSAYKYLYWMVLLSGVNRKIAKKYVVQKLQEINMWNLRNVSPNSFSSGQKKKILLAQALIHNPDIIVMDEPVANLDPTARKEFFDAMLQIIKKDKAIFISSHVLSELDQYANSITILDGGKIIYSGPKQTLLAKFIKHKYMIGTTNNKILIAYLQKNKISYEKSIEHDGVYIVNFKDGEQVNKLQKFIINKHINFKMMSQKEPTLQEVYDRLIVKGSVDTMSTNKPKK